MENNGKVYDPEVIRSLPENIQMNHGDLLELMEKRINHLMVDGRLIMQDELGEFVGYSLMEESYFVDYWLNQFALGRIDGKCYFDLEGWARLTDNYTKGIIIVNSEKKNYLFAIDAFTNIDFGDASSKQAFQYLGNRASIIFARPADTQGTDINDFAISLMQENEKLPEEDIENKFTQLVPEWFYKAHKVNHKVMKSIIYIRDNYDYKGEPLAPGSKILSKIEGIMEKYYNEDKLSLDEKELITEVTRGELFLENYQPNKVEKKQSIMSDEPFDPLSD